MRRLLAVGAIVVLLLTTGLAFITKDRQPPSLVLEHAVSFEGRRTLVRECVHYEGRVCKRYLYGTRPYSDDLDYWLLIIPIYRGNASDVVQVNVDYSSWLGYDDGSKYP